MSSCSTKTFYATKKDARQAKKGIRKRFHSSIKFYKCQYCDGWHLTTQKTDLGKRLNSDMRQNSFVKAIQSGQAEFVRRISKQKTIWKIVMGEEGFVVTYNKISKTCRINHYISVS